MTSVSVIMPGWKFQNLDKLNGFIKENFADSEEDIEYFEMVPVDREQLAVIKNIAIKFKGSDFNLKNLENLIEENRQLQVQMERAKETIQNLSTEYQKVFTQANMNNDPDQEKTLKRARKAKRLDEDNKKLRQLLKSQLENSERLRLETQNTIETLKEEFGLLVKELASLQRKNSDWRSQDELIGMEGHGHGHGHGKMGNFFGDTAKHHDLSSKVDRLEMLLGDQPSSRLHAVDHDYKR